MSSIHHHICPVCEATCGLEVQVEGRKVIAIRGQESDSFSKGYICPKGVALKDLQDDPDRLRTPLVKRNGHFVEASWDEAFAEIERRLMPLRAAHGNDSVAVSVGNPAGHKFGVMLYLGRLMKAMGSRNIYSASTLDQMPKQLSSGLMFGSWLTIPIPDIERCDFLLILGANPMASNGSLWTVPDFRGKAKALRERGGQIVVVDPRRTETAEIASRHLPIRPGGDTFLMLGMVHTLFAEKLVRLGRLAEHVAGVDALRDAIGPFTPEAVSARCGIAADHIRQLARDLAKAERAAVYGRLGTCTQAHGSLASWLIDVLNVLTGHLDEPGCAMFAKSAAFSASTEGKPGIGKGITTGRHHSRVSGAPEVFGELPMGCLAEEIETEGGGQIKALITLASNPVLSAPNGDRLAKAFDQLDFMLSYDIYLNETTRHADVILPGLAPLEDAHFDVALPQFAYRNHVRYSAPVLPAPEGHLRDWQILVKLIGLFNGKGASADVQQLDDEMLLAELQRSFGDNAQAVMREISAHTGPERRLDLSLRTGPYGEAFGQKPDGLTLAKVAVSEGGIDLGPPQPRIPEALRTPSGKIELAPPLLMGDLQRAEHDMTQPLPEMVIIGRRHVRSNNSWMHNLPLLAKGPFRCTALVNPADAARLKLTDGALARIAGHDGQTIEAQVEVNDSVMPGVVSLPHGWGHHLPGTRLGVAAERPGANLNAVLDERARDPLSGNAVLGGVPVEVTAA
ncbi:molybdopterin oxidoreductase family protein [Piscinibacter gummiphilus]|uniref:Molybdopterin oxidoreductase family protein n=1 Tax=Piscinibacter gummiphilus TaxID=946333 RepID=A0ABZ0CN36_9BURK|nr:molybdopterin oxidoreductase family protein [Piscinibacter gummiphilus]WOB06393.1 molybdopterin oxidoreductase family protein [Piscinibacter gummiphilus]